MFLNSDPLNEFTYKSNFYLFNYYIVIESNFSGKYSYQGPRQEIFWASAGFESTEESVTLSDASRRLAHKRFKS